MDEIPKKINCFSCTKILGKHEKFLKCDQCGGQYHSDCIGLDRAKMIDILKVRESIIWLCPDCKPKADAQYGKVISKLTELLDKQMNRINELESKLKKLESILEDSSSNSASAESSNKSNKSDASDAKDLSLTNKLSKEIDERAKRALNIIVVGLKTGADQETDFCKYLKSHLKLSDHENNEISSVSCLRSKADSSPKMLLVKVKSTEARAKILRAAWQRPREEVFESKIYFNEDLTIMQRSRLKELKLEMQKRRAAGERVRIRGLELIPDRRSIGK